MARLALSMKSGCSSSFSTARLLACAVGILAPMSGIHAQSESAPAPAAQVDPSDAYFHGYLLTQEAERLAAEKKYSDALEKYQQAQQLFESIHQSSPNWRKNMVEARMSKNQAAIDEITPGSLEAAASDLTQKAGECESRNDNALALAWHQKSLKRLEFLQSHYPEWEKGTISDRIARTRAAIERLTPPE